MKLPRCIALLLNWAEGEEKYPTAKKRRKTKIQKSTRPVRRTRKPVERRMADRLYRILAAAICVTVAAALLYTVSALPPFGADSNPEENEVYTRYVEAGEEETGAVNTVAGMILDYRAFDTLGESNVLFIAVCSVLILLRAERNGEGKPSLPELDYRAEERADDEILQGAAYMLTPVLLVFGAAVILNGHLSAGGGFSGGAVLGGAMILFANAFGREKLDAFFTYRNYKRVTFFSLMSYTLLKSYSFYTGANGLESGISPGRPGSILSAGLILPLNICVGLVVACTMFGFYSLFTKGGFGDGN